MAGVGRIDGRPRGGPCGQPLLMGGVSTVGEKITRCIEYAAAPRPGGGVGKEPPAATEAAK